MSIPHNILGVKIEGEHYAFDGDKVEQILRVPVITPVPLSDKAIVGISSISGKIITVVDTGLVLGGKEIDHTKPNARILTIEHEGSVYGVLVDEVLVMTTLNQANYEEVEKGNGKIVGFYKQSDAIYQIIDEKAAISTLNLLSFAPTNVDKFENKADGTHNQSLTSGETQRYLFLKLGEESFAISLEITREIIFVPEKITPVKEAGYGVLGVIVLRGELITAIDLRTTLGFDSAKRNRENRLLILNKDGKSLALLVDSIEEVKDVEMNLVEALPNRFSDSKIEAIYKAKTGITSLIDKSYFISMIEEFYIEDNDHLSSNSKSEHQMSEDASEIAVFKIGSEEYALEIENLQEIIKYTKETPVPEAPEFVDGIINLRGIVIPIFSLPERLGFKKDITLNTKILVCNIHNEKMGLLVDDVTEILFVNNSMISQSDSDNLLFSGVITLDQGKRIILKIEPNNIITKKLTTEIKDVLEDM
jgi:purine-binding chemotaxis protein CheW